MRPFTSLGKRDALFALFLACISPGAASAHNIAIFGDSLADGVWAAMYQEVKSHPGDKVIRDSKVGTGLTKPDFDTFLKGFAATFDRDNPTDVIVMFGANDEESLRDDAHKGFTFAGPGWTRVYDSRVRDIVTLCQEHHAKVIWLGLPILRDPARNQGALFLNGTLKDTTEKAGAVFVPLEDDFKAPDGSFASHLPDAAGKLREVRGPDGIHFTFYGYDLIAKKVYKIVSAASPGSIASAAAH